MTIQIDTEGLSGLYKETADKMISADRDIRSAYVGGSVREVKSIAKQKFATIGIEMPDKDLEAYAASVADGTDFPFSLT